MTNLDDRLFEHWRRYCRRVGLSLHDNRPRQRVARRGDELVLVNTLGDLARFTVKNGRVHSVWFRPVRAIQRHPKQRPEIRLVKKVQE